MVSSVVRGNPDYTSSCIHPARTQLHADERSPVRSAWLRLGRRTLLQGPRLARQTHPRFRSPHRLVGCSTARQARVGWEEAQTRTQARAKGQGETRRSRPARRPRQPRTRTLALARTPRPASPVRPVAPIASQRAADELAPRSELRRASLERLSSVRTLYPDCIPLDDTILHLSFDDTAPATLRAGTSSGTIACGAVPSSAPRDHPLPLPRRSLFLSALAAREPSRARQTSSHGTPTTKKAGA